MLTQDGNFLHEKEEGRQCYPIHSTVARGQSYCIELGYLSCQSFQQFIVETILSVAPECAQQRTDEGLLALHLVADSQRRMMESDDRLSLVKTIWKAYPEAANQIDKVAELPPFDLPILAGGKIGVLMGTLMEMTSTLAYPLLSFCLGNSQKCLQKPL